MTRASRALMMGNESSSDARLRQKKDERVQCGRAVQCILPEESS
jgi:hypothetical protein